MVESRCDDCKAQENLPKSPDSQSIEGKSGNRTGQKTFCRIFQLNLNLNFFVINQNIQRGNLMNKTLIAAAVSAALMAPVAAQADVTVYGRIHNGIAISSAGSTTDLNGAGGRFGFKASSDLGNGLTASAQYEFSTSTDKPGKGVGSTRSVFPVVSVALNSVTSGAPTIIMQHTLILLTQWNFVLRTSTRF